MPKAAGKWNVYEITAQGPHLVVVLNGEKTADVQDSKHLGGSFALQYGSGVVKFRKLQIKGLWSAEDPLDDEKGPPGV
jgi:hypothetical protein